MVFCAEEDFGIAPVEANAHGLPVIAYGRGAVRESMVDGATAEFFNDAVVDAVVDAIRRVAGRRWDHAAIRANAARFSAARFRDEFARQVRRVL
jgi:glycosyltransferase involved in cell wall biosynthesis